MLMNWHPSERGPALSWMLLGCICVVSPLKDPGRVIPAAVLSHSKRMTTGWLSKLLSSICLIWAFCLHLFWAPRLKAAALPLFASLLGSEENDNHEAWRPSTASHTNIHTYNSRNRRQDKWTHTHTRTVPLTQTYTHIQCETNAGSHKLLFVPHQVCKYMSVVYICNLLQSLHLILYDMPLFLYFVIILSGRLKRLFYIVECVFVLFLFIFNPSGIKSHTGWPAMNTLCI